MVPQILLGFDHKIFAEVFSVIFGICLLSLLAQIAIPLPWTPVPITGQTFGVTLVALSWGRNRAVGIFLGYLLLGSAGLPIFAAGASGLILGPTLGYFVGMGISSWVLGELSDKGFTKTFATTLFACFLGSSIVFSCGLLALSFFISKDLLLIAGLWPFVPGDLFKNFLAASIFWKVRRLRTHDSKKQKSVI